MVNQLVRAGVIDDVFSLCFGSVEGDGALLLGDAPLPGGIDLQYTPLLRSISHPFYYNVKMLSVAVDGQLLPVSQSLFDQGYGTVLDSGTTFTYMPTAVFQAFANGACAAGCCRLLQAAGRRAAALQACRRASRAGGGACSRSHTVSSAPASPPSLLRQRSRSLRWGGGSSGWRGPTRSTKTSALGRPRRTAT